ncbi:MAG: hypothetical protein JXR77_19740 [Lentisphaeria bacterium]|nr:hypothetical protein [Lentisphaeria bacterium]
MHSSSLRLGLCGTCLHRANCVLGEGLGSPVWYCEEFDDGAVAAVDMPAKEAPAVRGKQARRASVLRQTMGLCSNCEHRDTCRLTRPPGGVWHCEEYA